MNTATEISAASRLTRVLFVLLFVMLGFLAVGRILLIVRDFTSPTELTYPNSMMAYKAREVQYGRPLYTDIRIPPHVVALYGPLLYIVPGIIGRWLEADETTLFLIGRTFSLIGTVGAMAVIAWFLRRHGRCRWAAVYLGVLIYFTASILWPVSICFRPDSMEVFLTLLGLALFVAHQRSGLRWTSLAAFVGAFGYKQSGVVGPAAVVIYLVVNRRWREAVSYAIYTAVAYLGLVGILNLATGGLYWLNCVTALQANITWSNLVSVAIESALGRCLIPFVPAFCAVVWRWSRREFDLLTVFLVVSFSFASLSALRDGSADNYFLASLAAGTIIALSEIQPWLTSCASRPAESRSTPRCGAMPGISYYPVTISIILSFLFFLPAAGRDLANLRNLLREVSARRQRDFDRLAFVKDAAARLDALGGPVLCQFDPVNLYTHHSIMMNTLTFSGLADQGAFDDTMIVELIRSRRMAAVVLLFPISLDQVPRYQSTAWVLPSWVQALGDSGYREHTFGHLFVYTPPATGG